jgi:hypothetical protein
MRTQDFETAPHQEREKQQIEEMGRAQPERKGEGHCAPSLRVFWVADGEMDVPEESGDEHLAFTVETADTISGALLCSPYNVRAACRPPQDSVFE